MMMTEEEVRATLETGICRVEYTTLKCRRVSMYCTLSKIMIPSTVPDLPREEGTFLGELQKYVDGRRPKGFIVAWVVPAPKASFTTIGGWRSFYVDRLHSITVEVPLG